MRTSAKITANALLIWLALCLLCGFQDNRTMFHSQNRSSAASAPTFVANATQSASCAGPSTTCSATAITTLTSDLIWVHVFTGSGGQTINAPTDTCGTSGGASNTYTTLTTNTSGNSVSFWTLVGYGKSCVVTANFGGTPSGNLKIYIQQWRGVNLTTPIYSSTIGNQSSNGTGTNGVTSNAGSGTTISTNQSNDILAGDTIDCSGGPETISAGTGFTATNTPAFVGNCISAGEYESVASASSGLATTFTASVSNFRANSAFTIQHP